VLPSDLFVDSSGVDTPSQPLRVALFAPYDLARAGGVASHIRAQARALAARGHIVSIFGPASAAIDHNETAISGATLVTYGGTESGLGLDLRAARRVARLFAANPFDVVHVHEPLVPLVPWFALRYARSPVVGTFHVHRERGHTLYPIARPILARLMRRVSYRVAVSDAARRTVAAHFRGAYDVIPNGIDLERFRRGAPRPATLIADRRHVLYVGRLEARKGVNHLIDAMRFVQRSAPAARLVIVGDGPERSALAAHAASLEVDALFTGQVDDHDLPGYLQASDLVCAPALGGESFGIVLLEAMACGKPVVASRIEGYDTVLGGADCAFLVEPGNAHALADAIASVLCDDDLRRTLAARAARAVQQFDWSTIAARLEAIYLRLVRSTVPAFGAT
jgi:phosphatidylinositol alpha-mannosyltransferase